MSQLSELAVQVYQTAKNLTMVVGELQKLNKGIDHEIGEVHASIDKAAKGTDTQMVNAYGNAQNAIDDAINAIMAAAEKAEEWADNAVGKEG